MLIALIDAGGIVLSKDALMSRVWPNRIVEESSLQAQISALRNAFGADRDLIRTVAGRGCQFTGEDPLGGPLRAGDCGPCLGGAHSARPPTNLPEPVSELIGRDAEPSEVTDLVAIHRLVTLTGAGGIGKTRLGLEVARRQLPRFADGVWLGELAPLSDPDLVPVTVATALGLEVSGGCDVARTYRGSARCEATHANQSDPTDLLVGNRVIGISLYYLGDQAEARRNIEQMLSHYFTPVHRSYIIRFQFDQRVTARSTLARVLWLQGFPDQAARTTQSTLEEAQASDHALSLCNTLAQAACPVALLTGDLAAAERFVALLLDHSARHAPTRHATQGHGFEGALLIRRGEVVIGVHLLRAALDKLRESGLVQRYPAFLGELAEGLGRAGQVSEGLVTIDEALSHSERHEERWCISELLRIKGDLLLLQGGSGAAMAAEDLYRQALDWARRQDALSWELRAATSLARLRRDQERGREAIAVLEMIYDRFTEGFETNDLIAAKALLDAPL